MIVLTARIGIYQTENPNPFKLGVSRLGEGASLGRTISNEAVIDKRNLLSLETNCLSRSNFNEPSWGVVSNSGSISFKDANSRFLGYANSGILNEGAPIEILLKNTLTKAEKTVGFFYSKKWNYDNDKKTVSLSFGDRLEEMQSISVDALFVDAENPQPKTLKELYEWLREKTPSKYRVVAFDKLDEKTKRMMSSTVVKTPIISKGNLWQQWSKLCSCGGLYMFVDFDGNAVCRYAEGS